MKIDKKSGFTLVEMLVVMAIVSILSVVVLANYEWGGHQYSLRRSAGYLSQDLRRAQEMAMSAQGVEGGKIPPGGYGVHLDLGENQYIIFAERSDPLNYKYDRGVDTVVSVTQMEENIQINKLDIERPGGGRGVPADLDITFTPPNPTIRASGGTDYLVAVIKLQSSKTDSTVSVRVSRSGLIEIQ